MRRGHRSALAALAVAVSMMGVPAHAIQVTGVFTDADQSGTFTNTDLALSVTNNWDGQDFDCDRVGNRVQAFWDGMPPGPRFAFPEGHPCLGRSIYLSFTGLAAAQGKDFELSIQCDVDDDMALLSATFCVDCTARAQEDLGQGMNDFGDVAITTIGLTGDSSGFFAAGAPATTPLGTAIAVGAAALLLGLVVLRRLT